MMNQNGILTRNICGIIVVALAIISDAPAANVVQRPTTTNRVSVSRPSAAASRMPTMAIKTGNTSTSTSSTSGTTQSTTTTTTNTTVAPAVEPSTTTTVDTPTVENKSSLFGSGLSSSSTSERDSTAASLADLIRVQRAALDAADAEAVSVAMAADLSGTGENLCDSALRGCMMQKCGANFSKCIDDTDTTFFDKMDTCRRSTDCTGHEYQLFSAEIKADRDLNAKLTAYNATIDCGNNYDACIVSQCGATYSKCIGKTAGDNAIAKCESIAKSCIEHDSGMAMRTMAVFGELRQSAERQIATDEQRLYALREQMRSVCTRVGAMFDERSLDCVYTVNFRAGDDNTLFASKKLYAGSTFDCTQNWFGIDITTFRENAFRTTRAQASASGAMLGSGLGQAAGAITSGAISRAVKRNNAERALDDAIQDCIDNGVDANGNRLSEAECRAMRDANLNTGKDVSDENKDATDNAGATVEQLAQEALKNSKQLGSGDAAPKQPNGDVDDEAALCDQTNGFWDNDNNTCDCLNGPLLGYTWDEKIGCNKDGKPDHKGSDEKPNTDESAKPADDSENKKSIYEYGDNINGKPDTDTNVDNKPTLSDLEAAPTEYINNRFTSEMTIDSDYDKKINEFITKMQTQADKYDNSDFNLIIEKSYIYRNGRQLHGVDVSLLFEDSKQNEEEHAKYLKNDKDYHNWKYVTECEEYGKDICGKNSSPDNCMITWHVRGIWDDNSKTRIYRAGCMMEIPQNGNSTSN